MQLGALSSGSSAPLPNPSPHQAVIVPWMLPEEANPWPGLRAPTVPTLRPSCSGGWRHPSREACGEPGEDAGRRLTGAANHGAAHVPHVSAASPSAAPAPHGVRG